MAEIVESVMNTLGPDIIGPVAATLGLPAEVAQRGLQSSAAALLAGIAVRSREPAFIDKVWGLIKDHASSVDGASGLTSAPVALLRSDANSPARQFGSRVLGTVFGSSLIPVSETVGKNVGINGATARSLLLAASPAVLAEVEKQTQSPGWNARDLGETLRAHLHELTGHLPSDFVGMLGETAVVPSTIGNHTGPVPVRPRVKTRSGMARWLLPLLLVLSLIAVVYRYTTANRAPAPSATTPVSSAPDFLKITLPDGVVLNAAKGGVEDQLLSFIKDSSRPVDNTTWFNFDRLLFDTDKATLQPSSQEQLNNISAILKAFPKVDVKIGGYTDNVGAAEHNQKLSEERARNVASAIVAAGTGSSRIESAGYGDLYPVADNSSDAGRQQNRRIALRVTAK